MPEGLYMGSDIEKHIFPYLLMDKNMNHISYYLSGKAVKRDFITPLQLGVSEKISLGEDLCCTFPCYLNATSVYISKKKAYLYTVREGSMSMLVQLAIEKKIPVVEVEKSKLDHICNGANHQSVAAIAAAKEYSDIDDMIALAQSKGEKPFVIIILFINMFNFSKEEQKE